ncbi:glycoside hydrolase superfamily [Aspergillus spectabilis]
MTGWIDWRKFKSKGVNLDGWMLQEVPIDQAWWNNLAPNATNEWTLCETLGARCGPVLEERCQHNQIPTSYSAWVDVPGSKLYHGNQRSYLKTITGYAIKNYGMHIILGLHNLPGGVNGLEIGEAVGHLAWFGDEAGEDRFQGEQFWSQHFDSGANIVIDTHVYFFAAPNATSENVPLAICEQVPAASGDQRFPVFIGEYSLQSTAFEVSFN